MISLKFDSEVQVSTSVFTIDDWIEEGTFLVAFIHSSIHHHH